MKQYSNRAFTLIEILVVIAVIGVLSTATVSVINPVEQLEKGRDAGRKHDLSLIQAPLQAYFEDHGKFPVSTLDYKIKDKDTVIEWGSSWQPYMQTKVPKDALSSQSYFYQSDGTSYRLFAKLERCPEPQTIPNADCDSNTCNYSVTSSNIFPEATQLTCSSAPLPTSTPIPQPIACRSTDPIQFVGWSANAIHNFRGTFPINKPTGTQETDLMIAHIYSGLSGDMESPPPPGWNLSRKIDIPQPQPPVGDTDDTSFVFYKVAGPSEPASYSWDLIDRSQGVSGTIATYRNVNKFSPIHASNASTGTSTTYTAPSLTTTVNNTMLLALFGASFAEVSSRSWAHPVGMTERYDYDPLNDNVVISMELPDKSLTSAGPTGQKTATISPSDPRLAGVAHSIALTSCVPPSPLASGYAGRTIDQDFGTANGKKVHGCNGSVSYADAGTLCKAGWHVGDVVRDSGLKEILESQPSLTGHGLWIHMNGDPGLSLITTFYGPQEEDKIQSCWGTRSPCDQGFGGGSNGYPYHHNGNRRIYLNGEAILLRNGFQDQSLHGAICVEGIVDADGDTYRSIAFGGTDCNDNCATCFPGSTSFTSSADGKDQDCDGIVDERDTLPNPKTCADGGSIAKSVLKTGCETYCGGVEVQTTLICTNEIRCQNIDGLTCTPTSYDFAACRVQSSSPFVGGPNGCLLDSSSADDPELSATCSCNDRYR